MQHLEVKVLASNRVPVPLMFSVIQRNLFEDHSAGAAGKIRKNSET